MPYKPNLFHPKYRSDIDGMRAIAVLSVVVYHVFPDAMKGGFIGVDVFFVISGYLISLIIIKSLDNNNFTFIAFYFRRVRRIFPALIAVLVFTMIVGWMILFADEYTQLGKHVSGGAGFVANFILLQESGYFDTDADTKPLLHLWSLGIEEQFYILWPLLLWVSWKMRINYFIVMLIVAIPSFYYNLSFSESNSVVSFYSPATRAWELICGAMLAHFVTNTRQSYITYIQEASKSVSISSINYIRNLVSFAGIFLIAIGLFVTTEDHVFPGYWAVLPVLGTVLLIASGPNTWINREILSQATLVWIGLISYPLYLWHWPLLSLARIYFGELDIEVRLSIVFLSFIFAWLTYKLIERPIQSNLTIQKKITLALLGVMIVVGTTGYYIFINNGIKSRTINTKSSDLQYKQYKKDITKHYLPCKEWNYSKSVSSFCAKNSADKAELVLIGDSLADDKFVGISHLDLQNSWILIGKPDCPPTYGIKTSDNCQLEQESNINYIVKNKHIHTVVFSFLGDYGNKKEMNGVELDGTEETLQKNWEHYSKGLDSAVSLFKDYGKKIVILLPPPFPIYSPRDCLRNISLNCMPSKSRVISNQTKFRKLLKELQNKHKDILIYDPIDLFCTGEKCSYRNDNIMYFYDKYHLSVRGSVFYAKSLLLWLKINITELSPIEQE